MEVPLSWLASCAALPAGTEPEEVARRLTAAGLEVESVQRVGEEITGIVVARVLDIEELTGYAKPIRYCRVTAGDRAGQRSVICGAVNFTAGDLVPLAVPGATLPGGVEIAARTAYGRMSEGMICSARELGIGEDHSGILVLPPDAPLGSDFAAYAALRDVVLDVNVTPDKGHALSVRGLARELATAFGTDFTDPADAELPDGWQQQSGDVYPATIADPEACDRFVLREVRGIDPGRPTPLPMAVRLGRCGMRAVSLAVDVSNYLMLELGQPLHMFDRGALAGPIVVRRALPGERLETLDHVVRELDPDDILITDASGPISLAGTMGGLATEVTEKSTDLVIEAAHFSARGTARMSRRHRLFSEASARFERGVDYELPPRASAKAVRLLTELAGGAAVPGYTQAGGPLRREVIVIRADYPDQVAGLRYGTPTVMRRLGDVGCEVSQQDGTLAVLPPSWRPDLTDPADLAEEVIRLEGYERIGVAMPLAPAGRGRTREQRLRIVAGRALAGAGYVEVLGSPFASAADLDRLGLPARDPRRRAVRLANPLRDEEPLLRSTLLPGLFRVLTTNTGRGAADLAIFETGLVFRADGADLVAPVLPVDHRPSQDQLAEIEAALPAQPFRVAMMLAGHREPAGWWGPGRPAGFLDAIQAARTVLDACGLRYAVRADRHEPWHPGRCAAFWLETGGEPVLLGHAGELHPRVLAAFGLPDRASAAELALGEITAAAAASGPQPAPVLSSFPPASQDVSLTVRAEVPAAEVEAALISGAAAGPAGVLLEEVRLFDVYAGEQLGAGFKSLNYTLRFRATDRTLRAEEVTAARDAAVSEAARRTGAVLRSSG
jgi:phenylalanyl-tRNA synthetase beta chain